MPDLKRCLFVKGFLMYAIFDKGIMLPQRISMLLGRCGGDLLEVIRLKLLSLGTR